MHQFFFQQNSISRHIISVQWQMVITYAYASLERNMAWPTQLALTNQFDLSWKHKITCKLMTHKMTEWKQRVVFLSAERNRGRSCRGERREHKARWRTHFRAQSWIDKDITNLVPPFMISSIALSFLAISLISLFTLKDPQLLYASFRAILFQTHSFFFST